MSLRLRIHHRLQEVHSSDAVISRRLIITLPLLRVHRLIGNYNMKRVALFPGSFDPFTAGHLNILKRALTMFDEVVVAVGVNIDKRGFFPNEKRIEIIEQATKGLEGVSVIQYGKLTVDLCRELGIRHIVRGVRNMIDFETERSIADANRKLAPDVETIIIPTAQEYAHISSTAVRDILKHGGDTSLFVPEGVTL